MKKYTLYLFDFDGTLFDTYESLIRIYQNGFKLIGETCTPEDVKEYMHHSLLETAEMRGITGPRAHKFAQEVDDELNEKDSVIGIHIYDDVVATLDTLHQRNFSVALVSGNTKEHIMLVLEAFNLVKDFSFVIGCDPGHRRPKPYPDVILETLKEFPNVPKDQVVYIGDSLQDPLTAEAAGVDGILLERNKEYPNYQGLKISTLKELL